MKSTEGAVDLQNLGKTFRSSERMCLPRMLFAFNVTFTPATLLILGTGLSAFVFSTGSGTLQPKFT